MYPDESKYKYDPETAVEGEDYWYIKYQGQKVRQERADGGGTLTYFGGPCGPLYTDINGDM